MKTMDLNAVPSANRIHIGIFGRRNAGKSSIMNAMTRQNLAIVSDIKGTTTDPVSKAMELLPLGPVVITDTPGIDDEGQLGEMRVKKSGQVLNKTDIALLVVDASLGMQAEDRALLKRIQGQGIPYLVVMNKCETISAQGRTADSHTIWVSARTGENITRLLERIGAFCQGQPEERQVIGDLLQKEDLVLLVIPIDDAAPKGRLILPQQQTIRDILDNNAVCIAVQETELTSALAMLSKKPKIVVTDSQAFSRVARETPPDILLTSFSILFARYKGDLEQAVKGAKVLDYLCSGDPVLISEGCTHHRQCGDIGTVKLPHWIEQYTGVQPAFSFTSGTQFPEDLSAYRLIIHCGGCTLNGREMKNRVARAANAGIPMTNYGIAIAYMNGILKRSVQCFPEVSELLKG